MEPFSSSLTTICRHNPGMRFWLLRALAGSVAITSLAGCSGGGLASALGIPTTTNCSPTTATLNFPAVAGFGASASLNAASGCFSTATITTNAGPFPQISAFTDTAPRSQTWLYLEYTFSVTEFTSGLPSVTITVPATIVVPGRTFFLAYNGSEGSPLLWQRAAEGPVTANGTTLSFGGGGGGNITLTQQQPFLLALYSEGP
jgi:hypothetical protein